jgi:putative ABC transport system permease protein
MIKALLIDIRFGIRRLFKNRLFSVAAVLPMALGISVSTAMFTVGDALLRKPLAIPDIERLAGIVATPPDRKTATSPATAADYLDLERQNRSFERIAAYRYEDRVLTRGDTSVSVVTVAVSPEFFSVLGTSAQMGRTFGGTVNQEANTLVLSYAFWRDRLGANPAAIGGTIELDSQYYRVIGVMPKTFDFPVAAQVWRCLVMDVKTANNRTSHQIRLAGRLRPGVTLATSNTELAAIADRLAAGYPDTNRGWGMRAIPLSELITGRMTGQYVIFLLGGVLFVLVMACANVANLLLARGATRQNELAVREALGATRGGMVSLLLTESTLIAIIGAGLSLPLAAIALDMIRGNMPAEVVKYIPGFESIEMDHTAMLFALIMAALSGILAGITPALHVTRSNVNEVLKAGGRSGTASRGNTRLRGLFLIGEVALAMVLLVGTSLMVKGVHSLSKVNPETAPESMLTMWLDLPNSHYPDTASWEHFYSHLLDKLRGLPGVDSLAVGSNIPYGRQGVFLPLTTEETSSTVRTMERPKVRVEAISTGYFDTLRIGLRAGRNFNSGDRPEAPPVAIVSQGLANWFWPGQSPVRRRIRLDSLPGAPLITIIGIASEVSFDWLDAPSTPALYLPSSQYPRRANFVLVRSPRPRQLIGAIRERIRSIDPKQAVLDVKTWDAVIAESMIGLSYVAVIMTVLGAIALVLASFGLFGLMAYNVGSQRNELRVRIALGATAAMILRMVLGRSLILTGSGIAIGTGAALLMTRLLSNLIFGVNALDLTAYVLPGAALLIAGLASAYIPAHQASRMEVMRIDGTK